MAKCVALNRPLVMLGSDGTNILAHRMGVFMTYLCVILAAEWRESDSERSPMI